MRTGRYTVTEDAEAIIGGGRWSPPPLLLAYPIRGVQPTRDRGWPDDPLQPPRNCVSLAFATTAFAVSEPIDSVTLHSGGGAASWDPTTPETGCFGGVAYYPVGDGAFTSGGVHSDAFDGGLGVHVYSKSAGNVGFRDGDGQGDHVGESLTVGPRSVVGMRIVETDTGLPGSPTLRALVRVTNPTSKRMTRLVSICSNLGSDDITGIRASSDGNHKFTAGDRWVVTSDNATTPSDPPVTHVFSGKGDLRVTKRGLCAPGGGSDCVGQQMRLTLGAHKTRYLLFFAEMHFTNGDAIVDAFEVQQQEPDGRSPIRALADRAKPDSELGLRLTRSRTAGAP